MDFVQFVESKNISNLNALIANPFSVVSIGPLVLVKIKTKLFKKSTNKQKPTVIFLKLFLKNLKNVNRKLLSTVNFANLYFASIIASLKITTAQE